MRHAIARDLPPRPPGTVLWLHASPGAADDGIMALLADVTDVHPDLSIVATGDAPEWPGWCVLPAPVDTPAVARRFLDHVAPAMGVWVGGEPRPVLQRAALDRGIPLGAVGFEVPPQVPLRLYRPFADFAFRLGAAPARPFQVEAVGPLSPVPRPLGCNEAERAELADLLARRPVWLAAGVAAGEVAAVLAAHRTASQFAHRLLVILVPGEGLDPCDLARRAAAEGWSVARREADEDPEEMVQVMVADADELGLWYRLAPVTFVGGTLVAGARCRDPFEPAALGSAVLHGPETGALTERFGALQAAGGSCRVLDPAALGAAVEDLLAPDRAAVMAHAAWSVTTEGAEARERALSRISALLPPATA
ncbi:3-deoxy-D-manno-octulosonic acid transferase [Rhodobacteraceae bacterium CCMM004]|nr:3-deoxy-D-manno-octulosonic acid transferase [Rhodobacteraceae bacterium CCMM004]